MSPEEWVAWRAVDAVLGPIGSERADRHAALVASVIANVNRDATKRREPFDLDDFDLYRDRKPLTRAQEEEQFRAAFASAGLVRREGDEHA